MFQNKEFKTSLPYYRKYIVPGPRFDTSYLHPDLMAKLKEPFNNTDDNEKDLIQRENEESHRRLEDLKTILPKDTKIYSNGYLNCNGKEVNEDLVYKVIAKSS